MWLLHIIIKVKLLYLILIAIAIPIPLLITILQVLFNLNNILETYMFSFFYILM